MYINITNNGPDILETNFWDTEFGHKYYAFGVNAGCMRVLIPIDNDYPIADMLGCDYAIVSTIANPQIGKVGIEILFEDHSDSPFCLHLGPGAGLGLYPLVPAKPIERSLSLWVKGPTKLATMKAYFRKVPRLPYLKPLA